jgi:uncharacterized membrane protein YgcG
VGSTTKEYLTPSRIQLIMMDMKHHLRSKQYGTAVERAVVQIGLLLAGAKGDKPQKQEASSAWMDYAPFALMAAVFAFTQGHGFWKQRRRADVSRHLRRLQHDLQVLPKLLDGGNHNNAKSHMRDQI